MTEAQWLACDDPEEMSAFLLNQTCPPSDRKLRLAACACCRLMGHNLVDGRSKKAVVVAERFADGLTSQDELNRANADAREAIPPDRAYTYTPAPESARLGGSQVIFRGWPTEAEKRQTYTEATEHGAASSAYWTSGFKEADGFGQQLKGVIELTIWQGGNQLFGGDAVVTRKEVADLLRDVVGNPFRHTSGNASWLPAEVVAIAQSTYDELRFDELPVLADALEDAGCADEAILSHLRSPGLHVRGCWALDLILGKS